MNQLAVGFAPRCAKVTASRLLTRATVKAQIEARERAEAQRLELDRQAIVGKLLECSALAKAQANPAAMVTAQREIGRLLRTRTAGGEGWGWGAAGPRNQIDERVPGWQFLRWLVMRWGLCKGPASVDVNQP